MLPPEIANCACPVPLVLAKIYCPVRLLICAIVPAYTGPLVAMPAVKMLLPVVVELGLEPPEPRMEPGTVTTCAPSIFRPNFACLAS